MEKSVRYAHAYAHGDVVKIVIDNSEITCYIEGLNKFVPEDCNGEYEYRSKKDLTLLAQLIKALAEMEEYHENDDFLEEDVHIMGRLAL